MPSRPPPSSSVQRARRELAARLRDIRLDAGLTGRAMSAAAGWHEAKTSRIEGAKQAVTDDDLRVWCRVCGADDRLADLIAANRAAESAYVELRRLLRTGLRRAQEVGIPLYERTRTFKVYCSNVVPGLLQTPEYANALMKTITGFHGTPDDVDDAVAARLARNGVLHSGDHRFAVIIEESVLHAPHGGPEVMSAQLRHLVTVASLPSVSLGVIPANGSHNRPMWTLEAFNIFDDARVEVELLSAQITITAPTEVAVYRRAFSLLGAMAVFGVDARALIETSLPQ